MSEEEKEAINNLRFYSTNVGFSKYDGTTCVLRAKDVQIVLNLIGKQYAELNNLKEIEKSHQEENGKLRVEFEKVYQDNLTLAHELEQEKEKNMQLNEKNIMYKRSIPNQSNFYDFSNYISKDKIKEMMKYREFELQQEYKEFEEDVEWRTYKKILEGK